MSKRIETKVNCVEAEELITALVDQELGESERNVLEAHLAQCARCRSAFETEHALKQEIRAAGELIRAPGALRDRILSDPRIFPEQPRATGKWRYSLWPLPPRLRPALAIVLLLVLALPAFYWFKPKSEPIAFAALQTYDLFLRGELPVPKAAKSSEIEAQLTSAVGGRFHPMGYDLTAMQLQPVAGLVRELQGRKILIAVYQGEGGSLFCYTFLGSEEDAPPNAARFFDAGKKMNFYAFSRDGVNAVLHREGEVICILVSEMAMERLLELAESKAKPS